MGLLGNKWFWLSGTGLLVSGGLGLVAVGWVLLAAYGALVGGGPIVSTLLGAVLPALLALAVFVVLFVVSLVGLAWVLVQYASLPRSESIARLAERAEREYSELRILGLSEFLSPPEPTPDERAEDALSSLKRRYVEGEITEAEFERKVDRLVSNDSLDEARAAREREQILDGGSRYD